MMTELRRDNGLKVLSVAEILTRNVENPFQWNTLYISTNIVSIIVNSFARLTEKKRKFCEQTCCYCTYYYID